MKTMKEDMSNGKCVHPRFRLLRKGTRNDIVHVKIMGFVQYVFSIFFLMAGLPAIAQSVKLVTYNIRLDTDADGENAWKFRKDFLAAQIRFYAPDIFGVQEALPGQVAYLDSQFPEYGRVGIGRDGPGKGEASCIYFRKERFQVQDSGTFWLSETPDILSKGWDAALNRVCSYGKFREKNTGKTCWVFNTHLDHMGELARTKGIELILSRIETLSGGKSPVVLMGDFNSEPHTQRIQDLKKRMLDARDISAQLPFGPAGTFNGFRHDAPVSILIDYVFVSKEPRVRVIKYAVLSDSKDLRYPSDHLPVFAEISLQ